MIQIQYKDIPYKTNNPALTYCRKLMGEGFDYNTRLEVYREEVLCLIIKSIGDAAKITVKEDIHVGPVFVKYKWKLG